MLILKTLGEEALNIDSRDEIYNKYLTSDSKQKKFNLITEETSLPEHIKIMKNLL